MYIYILDRLCYILSYPSADLFIRSSFESFLVNIMSYSIAISRILLSDAVVIISSTEQYFKYGDQHKNLL